MAQSDFCFTYYDGDAARDKAHMSRLERGAYDDIISAQRKRGHLSEQDIKKVLGADFESCWPAMEWVLKKDDQDKFFIEWVETSLKNRAEHSEKQRVRIQKYWDKKKENDSMDIPRNKNGITTDIPLGSGNENGDGNEYINNKGGMGEKEIIPRMQAVLLSKNPNYPTDTNKDAPAYLQIAKFICEKSGIKFKPPDKECQETILEYWGKICDHVVNDNFLKRYSVSQMEKHIQSIVLSIQDGNNKKGTNSKITADKLNEAHAKYFGGQ